MSSATASATRHINIICNISKIMYYPMYNNGLDLMF